MELTWQNNPNLQQDKLPMLTDRISCCVCELWASGSALHTYFISIHELANHSSTNSMHIIKLTNENLRDSLEAIAGEKPTITVGIMQMKGETKFRPLIFVTRQFNYHI
jgi:hypothetical protein